MKIRLKLNAAVHQWDVHLKKSVAQLVPKEGCQAIQLTSHLAADATKLQARFRSLGRYQPCTDLTAAERMAIVVVWMRMAAQLDSILQPKPARCTKTRVGAKR